MISICLIPYSLCILDAAHDRILSVRKLQIYVICLSITTEVISILNIY